MVHAVPTKVQFFRVVCGYAEDGSPIEFDHAGTFRAIDQLPWDVNAVPSRYLDEEGGKSIACWVTSVGRVKFGRTRRRALPDVERQGKLTKLPIHQDAGIVDMTHVVFFDHDIAGIMLNGYSPRPSMLSRYLDRQAGVTAVIFEPLLRQDVLGQLAEMESLRLLRLRVRAPYISYVKRAAESLGGALEAAANVGDAAEVEVVLRTMPRSKESLSGDLFSLIRDLIRTREPREGITSFIVSGRDYDGQELKINLLEDALISKKAVVRESESSRALDSRHAFEAIESAFQEQKHDLLEASGVA